MSSQPGKLTIKKSKHIDPNTPVKVYGYNNIESALKRILRGRTWSDPTEEFHKNHPVGKHALPQIRLSVDGTSGHTKNQKGLFCMISSDLGVIVLGSAKDYSNKTAELAGIEFGHLFIAHVQRQINTLKRKHNPEFTMYTDQLHVVNEALLQSSIDDSFDPLYNPATSLVWVRGHPKKKQQHLGSNEHSLVDKFLSHARQPDQQNKNRLAEQSKIIHRITMKNYDLKSASVKKVQITKETKKSKRKQKIRHNTQMLLVAKPAQKFTATLIDNREVTVIPPTTKMIAPTTLIKVIVTKNTLGKSQPITTQVPLANIAELRPLG